MLFIFRKITHIIFPVKKYQYSFLKRYSSQIQNKRILEVGAGKGYDVEKFFSKSNEYIKTDLIPSEGVTSLDITKDKIPPEYDVIICLNVLEHIFDFKAALENIYNGLKRGGILFFSVPLFYPLHMLPNDYWRFTPATLEKLFLDYQKMIMEINGLKRFPFNVNILAIK
ncbi:MAG: methyltransferase domain-containing protein [Candidatus Heimdallarchaeota archaeon]|nr:methyltransferase domain-containing protein [Candidatus Heimdallarchaeota archaeon]